MRVIIAGERGKRRGLRAISERRPSGRDPDGVRRRPGFENGRSSNFPRKGAIDSSGTRSSACGTV